MNLTVAPWTKKVIDPSTLSALFVEFYKAGPWNEYLFCPRCKPVGDFGPAFTWGEEDGPVSRLCPVCGSELELFWSESRVAKYLFEDPDNEGIVGLIDHKPACWLMGRPTDQCTFYIDVIAIMKEYRVSPGFKYFLDIVFQKWKSDMVKRGFTTFTARSHKEAKNVRLLFKILGFEEGEDALDDSDRRHWTLTVTRQLAC